MKKNKFIWLFFILCCVNGLAVMAQSESKLLREGNKAYREGDFNTAEINYRRVLEENPHNITALYNLSNALYRQNNYQEAARIINSLKDLDVDKQTRAKMFHNLGNSFFRNEQYAESVEAYKDALRIEPDDFDTKYNLAHALSKLQQQEQQQQDQCENNQQQDEQDQEEQEQDQEQDQDQDQEQQEQEDSSPEPMDEISQEDAERILDALERQEENLQEELKRQQQRQQPVNIERDW